ncbi:MAG: ral secretion pathway protein [Myxococcales bacterium]|nr:ral secretion pathway protein [Myxococcales bacterium]
MSDAGEEPPSAPQRKIRLIAIGCAIAALVIAVVAAIVVVNRSGSATVTQAIEDHRVAASDVARISKLTADLVTEGGITGARIRDPSLARALSLGPSDLITAISGMQLRAESDLHDIVFQLTFVRATTLYVELERDHQAVLVRWKIDGDLRMARPSRLSVTPPYVSPYAPQSVDDPDLDTIKKIDDTHYEIPRSTFDSMFAGSMKLMSSARVVPTTGKGFSLYSIRPGSLLSKLGIQNGDTLRGINGDDVSTPDKALELYTKARSMNEFTIELERRGQPVFLHVTITK